SLTKLFIMAAAYQAVEDGSVAEEDIITNLTEMITVSSNSASNLLLGQIGYTAPKEWIKENGYKDTYYCRGFLSGVDYENTVIGSGNNYSTVVDIGRLLTSIYDGVCVSEEASAKMTELLKKQKRVSKIPAGVPVRIVTANKTGEVQNNTHDCAIVYLEENPYVLCVMTQISHDAQTWDFAITDISRTVFEYMEKLK
ncbi:MAG: serine hydrolase, partial [Clostridia bacterium]|nr:serine hydrolase [Clostridia bacterium]